MEEKGLPPDLVRNAGVFYVCHRLSQMGWNALPSTHKAKGPNIVIDSKDVKRTRRLKVRSLSKRDPVPLGKDPNIDADWVVVCIRVREGLKQRRIEPLQPEDIANAIAYAVGQPQRVSVNEILIRPTEQTN